MDSQGLQQDIASQHGPAMTQNINGFLQDFGSGYPKQGQIFEQAINWTNKRFSASVLGLKPSIGTKQLVSWFAMSDGISTTDFLASHADFATSGKQIVNWLFEHGPAVQNRGSSVDFEMAAIGSEKKALIPFKHGQRVQDFFFSFIRLGDRVPIYAGGWAVYQNSLMKQSKRKKRFKNFKETKAFAEKNPAMHKEAMLVFQQQMNSTQQSNDLDKQSALQRSGAIGRSLTLFMTARFSLLRAELTAIRHRPALLGGTGKLTYREFGKRMALYHFAMPMMIQWIASGFEWDEDRQLVAALLGQLNSFVIFGDLMTIAMTEMFTDQPQVWTDTDIPLAQISKEMWNGVSDFFSEDTRGDDMLDAMKEIAGAAGKLAGQPVDQVLNFIGGAADMADGELEKGALRMWGSTEKTAEKAASNR